MSYNLFLTKIHEDQYFLPNKLFLGQWSIGDEVQTSNLGNYKIVDYHWDNSEKLDKDYEYLYDLYYELLKSLRISLNNIHKLDKSERYWQLVLGSWLEMFLVCAFDRWECVSNAFTKYNISNVYSFKSDYMKHIVSDLSEFHRLTQTQSWNNFLITEIIKFKKISNINFKENINYFIEEKKKNYQSNKFSKKKNLFFSFFDNFAKSIQKKPEVVLYQTYFKKKDNLLLFAKTKTLPRLYFDFEKKIDLNSPSESREIFDLDFKSKNNFEKFLKNYLFKFMPITYLEGFKKIKDYCENIITKPKLVISATGHINDVFSHWVAQNIDEGTNYFIAEHGGCIEDTAKFDTYMKKSDCFLSWNHSDKEKVFQIAPRFYTKKIDQKNINKGDKIYIILAGNHLYNFIAQYALKSGQIINTYNSLKELKTLPQKIKDNLKFRPHPGSHGWAMEKRVKVDFGDEALCKYEKIDDSFSKAKLLINIDFQTAFYESMHSQKPVVVFADRKLTKNMNPKIRRLFEKFIEQKIIINNIEDLKLHLQSIWENPLKWWNSDQIKVLRNEFSVLCSRENNKNFIEEIITLKKNYAKK